MSAGDPFESHEPIGHLLLLVVVVDVERGAGRRCLADGDAAPCVPTQGWSNPDFRNAGRKARTAMIPAKAADSPRSNTFMRTNSEGVYRPRIEREEHIHDRRALCDDARLPPDAPKRQLKLLRRGVSFHITQSLLVACSP